MRRTRALLVIVVAMFAAGAAACQPVPPGSNTPPAGHTFYLSPTGNDTTGTGTKAQPWQHFAKAFSVMRPGDRLWLADGTYHDTLLPPPALTGTASAPIQIWAEHDGKARINGGGVRVPVRLSGNDYFDIWGIVAYNSIGGVVVVEGTPDNRAIGNVFRRVSAYNSAAPDSDPNHHVWELWRADNTLVEDCAAAGRGRTIMTTMESDRVTFRRCWFRADARTTWQNGSEQPVVQIYNATNSTFENNVVTAGAVRTVVGVVDWNNVYGGATQGVNVNNHYYGNVVTTVGTYGMSLGTTQCKLSRDHVWRDNVVIGSEMGYALRGGKNLQLTHNTAIGSGGHAGVWLNASVMGLGNSQCSPNNGNNDGAWGYYADAPGAPPYQHAGFDFTAEMSFNALEGYPYGADATVRDHTPPTLTSHDNNVRGTAANFANLARAGANDTNAVLTWPTATYGTGAYLKGPNGSTVGAQVVRRYVDRTLTAQPLWPWPMENRIWNETGDPQLWRDANPLFPVARQQSVTWDGVNGRTGGLWKQLP